YVNLILDIIFGGFALTVGIASILVTTTDPASAIAAAAIIGSATCGLVIVFVINFIVALMSVIRMHHGAREYGPDHQKNAGRGGPVPRAGRDWNRARRLRDRPRA